MDWVEMVGYAGTALTFAAWGMKGAVPLRVFGMASSVAFLAFGLLSQTWPVVATELVLLPLNAYRLSQLLLRREAPETRPALARLIAHGRRERLRRGAAIVVAGEERGRLTLAMAPGDGALRLIGDARPFRRATESRTILAEEEVVVMRVDLAALEAAGAREAPLGQELVRLALAPAAAVIGAAPVRLAA